MESDSASGDEKSESDMTSQFGSLDINMSTEDNSLWCADMQLLIEMLPPVIETLKRHNQLQTYIKWCELLKDGEFPLDNICYIWGRHVWFRLLVSGRRVTFHFTRKRFCFLWSIIFSPFISINICNTQAIVGSDCYRFVPWAAIGIEFCSEANSSRLMIKFPLSILYV
jgi:hypothetical protein